MKVTAWIAVVAVAGCSRSTSNERAGPCPPWTVRGDAGICLARPWTLPASSSAVGRSGARLRALAIDGKGRGIAAWEASLPSGTTVEIGEETSPGLWTTRSPLGMLGGLGADSAPSVAADRDGAAVVAWIHAQIAVPGAPTGLYTSERSTRGEWTDPTTRPFATGGIEPFVATASTGEWFLTWCQPTKTGWGVALARRDAGAQAWELPHDRDDVISPDILFANQPRIAASPHGDVLAAWYQSEGVPLMTYVSERRGPTGAFSRPDASEHLSPSGAAVASDPIANPKPALGPRGEAAVVWAQDNGAGATPLYLATRTADGSWRTPSSLADAFSRANGRARSAQLGFGADGSLHVVWVGEDDAGSAVYGARRSADGTWIDGGRHPVRLSSLGRAAFGPTLATGPGGAVLAAWVEIEGPHDTRIAVRRTGGAKLAWETIEWLSPSQAGEVGAPLATIGSGDRVLVGWASGPAGEARIVFARID